MSNSYYSVRISTEEEKYSQVSKVLGVKSEDHSKGWMYEVESDGNDYFDFINEFLNLLEGKMGHLNELGISSSAISIWWIYEYTSQCNMEFHPKDLERLGKNGITLCISCYEVNER